MSNKWLKSTRTEAFILLGLESAVILGISIALVLINGLQSGYSLLLGGAVSILPNAYFTYRVFKNTRPSQAKYIVRTFYRSEFIKLVLMGIFFIAIVNWVAVSIIPFVMGFFIAQMGVWLAPLLLFKT